MPCITILESVSLQKYWSTDGNKVFDLHGLQVSGIFNSTNSEPVKTFPSPSCFLIKLKLRCFLLKLIFLQSTTSFSQSSELTSETIVTSFVHSRTNLAGRFQTAC